MQESNRNQCVFDKRFKIQAKQQLNKKTSITHVLLINVTKLNQSDCDERKQP